MEKFRLEASNRSASASLTPCICTVCGLVLSTQLPLFAVEAAPKPAVTKTAVAAKTDEIGEQTLRPMAFRRTTTAPSPAKSQVSQAQSTPLQTLKPTTSSQATRFALTAPAAEREMGRLAERNQNEGWTPQPDQRIVMTALPTDDDNISNRSTQTASDAPSNISTTKNSTAKTARQNLALNSPTPSTNSDLSSKSDILDSVALAQKTAFEADENAPIEGSDDDEQFRDNQTAGDIQPTGNIQPAVEVQAATNAQFADAETGEPLTGTITIPQKPVAAPAAVETKPASGAAGEKSTVVTADSQLGQTSRLFAPSISYEGGTIVAEGTAEDPVRLEGTGTRIVARKVRLDTVNKIVRAEGTVQVERQILAKRFNTFGGKSSGGNLNTEMVTETLKGENFEYNYATRQGKLGETSVRLSNLNIYAEEIIINGTKYIARNVIIRPGGLTEEEIRIYGTPPLSIRTKYLEADTSQEAPPNKTSSDTSDDLQAGAPVTARTQVRGAGLYFKNFRVLPIPAALLGRTLGGPREEPTYQLTPRIAFNSADGLLVTVGLKYPFTPTNPDRLTLTTDIGLSTKVGFRGGIALDTSNRLGRFAVGARINDVISSQLTNRIELDRLPEFTYDSPRLPLFELPGGRRAGLRMEFSAGDYRERFTTDNRSVQSSRVQAQVRFTTRMGKSTGPYLDLVARSARYSRDSNNLTTAGFEVGYAGSLGSRINGQFSFGSTKVNGSTPFEFDKVAIEKELRATFDILLTPRYIIPIDLRYDLDRKSLRERTFGILRNYKTFAYGLTYQSSRQELQLQVRQGF